MKTKSKARTKSKTPRTKATKTAKKPARSTATVDERRGVFFATINNKRRSVYEQNDHTLIVADECRCRVIYAKDLGFEVVRTNTCPVDEHRAFHGRRAS